MVTCGLTACTPGSALGPTLGIEYGKAFTFIFYLYFLCEKLFGVVDITPLYWSHAALLTQMLIVAVAM